MSEQHIIADISDIEVFPNSNLSQNHESKESKIFNISNGNSTINLDKDTKNNIFENQSENFNERQFVKFFEKNKKENISQSLEIKNEENKKKFFIRVFGHELTLYIANEQTKIRDIIENYIKGENLNDELKYHFYYKDKRIENLENTIGDIKIEYLGIIENKDSI